MSPGDGERDGEGTFQLEDISFDGPNLDVPNPPAGTPYEEFEDYRTARLLEANDLPTTADGIVRALQDQTGVLLAAAAHAAGSQSIGAAIPRLRQVVEGSDDQAAVEAAYALGRLGDAAARQTLVEAVSRPADAYLSALVAAGYLAQLGDPIGFPKVEEGLGSGLSAIRMLACKQLYFFMPFDGANLPSGGPIDAAGAYQRALQDPDPDIQWQALAELRLLRSPATKSLLDAYVERAQDEGLRRVARETLESLGS